MFKAGDLVKGLENYRKFVPDWEGNRTIVKDQLYSIYSFDGYIISLNLNDGELIGPFDIKDIESKIQVVNFV